MGGRFVLKPKTKKDAYSSHVMLGLKSYSVRLIIVYLTCRKQLRQI